MYLKLSPDKLKCMPLRLDQYQSVNVKLLYESVQHYMAHFTWTCEYLQTYALQHDTYDIYLCTPEAQGKMQSQT